MKTAKWFGRGISPLPRLALAAGMLMLPLAACDVEEILDVTDPDIVDPADFTDETALPTLLAGVTGDFHEAYIGNGGTQEGQILVSGLLGDEYFHSGTFPTRSEIDIRNIDLNNGTLQFTTRNLYRARRSGEAAAALARDFAPNSAGLAEVLNLTGFTYIYFAENYCSGVPFSELTPDGNFEFGEQETTQEVFMRALEGANEAIEVATAAEDAAQLSLARVLKGRALLNLGRYDEAAEAVAEVPTSFSYTVLSSENTTREQNAVYVLNTISERWSIPNEEGMVGLPWREANDPRVEWRRTIDGVTAAGDTVRDFGFDRTTPQYNQLKYADRSAEAPVANGIEARLIEAEAALQAGNTAEFLAIHNDLRESFFELDPLDATGLSMDDMIRLHFQERAFWLWQTSHRLGDMRRLIRPATSELSGYGFPEDEVFPTGDYHKSVQGGVYGSDVNLPLSIDERNNPAFADIPSGQDLCLDRDP